MAQQNVKPLEGPEVWQGANLRQAGDWVWAWTADELAEIDEALAVAGRSGKTWDRIERADLPLPRVATKLAAAAEELESGRGLVKLTGLPVARYSADELKTLWFGLVQHLGRPVFQDCLGQLMREIRDEGGDLGGRHGRLVDPQAGGEFLSSKARTYSSGPLRFHTDRCDVVGLLAVRQAKAGGLSRIASAPAIHNAMLARRPDLLAELYRPIHRSRLGEEAGGETVVYPLPVFGLEHGKFTSHFSRTYIEAAQLQPGTPAMTARQWEALDLLQALAEELCFEMRLEPGDIQFLNNHVIYHARGAFEDDAASGQDRLLYRVWLTMANSRALPADHAVLWRNVAAGAPRGGIGQDAS